MQSEHNNRLFNIAAWSQDYFHINSQGHLNVRDPRHANWPGADLYQIVDELSTQGLHCPLLLRFPHILRHRVEQLQQAFHDAMERHDYQGRYHAVYPIKVNQQRSVVQTIAAHGSQPVGLEAGSKPELLAVLALTQAVSGLVICNGYKDREFIRLALIGQQLGHRVVIVIEKPSELSLIIDESRQLGLTPMIGVRVRLMSVSNSKWQNSGGESAKFGLDASQLLNLCEQLREFELQDALCLMHFHLGSQITDLDDIQGAMQECSAYYQQIAQLGFNLRYVDVGGGLGVDYQGTASRHYFSMNYSLRDYADRIVAVLRETCKQQRLPHPHIITEAGRAMSAHHAVLITNVVDAEYGALNTAKGLTEQSETRTELLGLQALSKQLQAEAPHNAEAVNAMWQGAKQHQRQLQDAFIQRQINLHQKARGEQLFHHFCQLLAHRVTAISPAPQALLDELQRKLACKYYCNFSLFQSIPDAWAIQQIFPVMPIHRLNEAPTRRVTLHDITCDSDGRIDDYVDSGGIESSLPLHALIQGERYYLGIFLVGAYQEILGDMHNLFGDTHSANIELTESGYQVADTQYGDRVADTLDYVHYHPQQMIDALQKRLAQSGLDHSSQQHYLQQLRDGLEAYTYLHEIS